MNHIINQHVAEARSRLEARSAELRDRVQRVRQDVQRRTNPLPRDSADAAIVLENDEILEAIEESALGELAQIKRALGQIEKGSFGVCEGCGREIVIARLRAVPYATRCQRCAGDG